MKVGVDIGLDEKGPRVGLNVELKNEIIGTIVTTMLCVTAIVIVEAVCKSNRRRGSLSVMGIGKISIGK